ncbi:AraC family transcriptional regulator [Neobacillus vireti]|uniref:AraC-like ligand binding domain/transcriptional regulator, AraC family protein n=1 Tax=Neobacillus vireti LMG 21834 TaxID=1131730 RepID=A0AB94IS50_9BACI|nr:AraC family transcriptional regulator [Neobacillus vireti]ETI69920.1 AraC-like ligand binding domain/transcriptional regulator, AraC family protein [Neobacillus vireti LMG 21834]KLT17992.1 transcriptional regulator [Neobacillus vireti]
MDLHKYISGKISLNDYLHRLNQNGASFQVHYWGVMPQHYDTPLHKHSFFEVCYVVEGKGIYTDDYSSYLLQENTIFLSRPEVLHQIKSEKGLSLLYVAFELIESESSESWIRIVETAKQCTEIVVHGKDEIETALLWKSLLIQATKRNNEFFEEVLSNIAYSLIISILQDFVPDLNKSNHMNIPEKYSMLLNQAQLYIHDNLSNSLKLTEVAKHLHISGRHLSRIFVSELGVSFSKYVRDERINRAVLLLKKTNLSIKEIAEETGFINVQYFTRVFTTMMQTSPGRFRSLFVDINTTTYSDN